MRRIPILASLFALVLAPAGCGGSNGGSGEPTPSATETPTPSADSYEPLATGNSWSYDETDTQTGTTRTKTVTVGNWGTVGGSHAGVSAFEVDTARSGGGKKDWQADLGSQIVRYREQTLKPDGSPKNNSDFDPEKLRVDRAQITPGATWTEDYTETLLDADTGETQSFNHHVTWTVVAVDEQVTVPAGTFPCVELHRVSQGDVTEGSDKTFWFAKGVGKVKEVDTGISSEVLTSYTLAQ
jgi:hypothetical protein